MKVAPPAELHLPDLPELPLSLGPATPPTGDRRVRPPWPGRVRDWVSGYLPLLLMTALALGTWWVAKNSPGGAPPVHAGPVRHEPDYTLDRFQLQRFDPTGALKVVVEGEHMRHYPDEDVMEVETIRVTSTEPDGRRLVANARQGRALDDGSQVWLDGEAQVVGEQPGALPVHVNGEHLRAQPKTRRVESDAAVVVTQGDNRFEADGMVYDHDEGRLQLLGHTHGVYHGLRGGRP